MEKRKPCYPVWRKVHHQADCLEGGAEDHWSQTWRWRRLHMCMWRQDNHSQYEDQGYESFLFFMLVFNHSFLAALFWQTNFLKKQGYTFEYVCLFGVGCCICYVFVRFSLISYSRLEMPKNAIVHFKCVEQNYTFADDMPKQKTITEDVVNGEQNNSLNY